jgi:hypothetical protein
MISPDTSPGTEIICIDDSLGPYGNGGLRKGNLYTVDRIVPAITGGFVVLLIELPPWRIYAPPWGAVEVGFELKRFRYLDVPVALTKLLEAVPTELET